MEISSAVPGSWSPNWLHGTPKTVKARTAFLCCSSSSPVYCGVRPNLDATLTARMAFPADPPDPTADRRALRLNVCLSTSNRA